LQEQRPVSDDLDAVLAADFQGENNDHGRQVRLPTAIWVVSTNCRTKSCHSPRLHANKLRQLALALTKSP
jgi:hypothetical protein